MNPMWMQRLAPACLWWRTTGWPRTCCASSLSADGRQARQRIEQDTPPALAVLDIDLPYHDGFELIEAIRTDGRWREVPILMLSSKGTELDIVRALDTGADDFIVKPFQLEELKARVRRRIRGRR